MHYSARTNLFPISKRTKLGVLAVLLLATAGVLKLIPAEHAPANSVGLFGACWRIGFVLAVFWLAYPDLARLPRWLMPAVLLVGLAMARWPWLLWAVPGVIFVGWLLRPREPLPRQRR